MEEILETRELRLVGPDGTVSAVFKAGDNHSVNVQLGKSGNEAGILLLVTQEGECQLSLGIPSSYSSINLMTYPDDQSSTIGIGNAEGQPVLFIAAEQNTCIISLNDGKGNRRLSLSVRSNGVPTAQVSLPDGTQRSLL